MEPDELPWIDSVPVRRARAKRITIGEYEWVPTSSTADGRARFCASFLINHTELVALLVEDRSEIRGVRAGRTSVPPPPRLRLGNRWYLLFIETPQD